MITTKQTFSSKTIRRVSVFSLCAVLLGILTACTDSQTDTENANSTIDATSPLSIGTPTDSEIAPSVFSDISNARLVTTDGFVGEVLDGSIQLSWKKDPYATGYNIYRGGKYYTTVYKTEFNDVDIQAQDYAYEVKAFEKSDKGTRYYTIATGLIVSAPQRSVDGVFFNSSTTAGFVGEIRDNTIRISWKADPDATGYNVYRQGKYYTTVYKTEFQDADIQAQDYAYEIKAFEKSGGSTRYYTIASGLTVSPRPATEKYVSSSVTDGFTGEVRDGKVRVSWKMDAKATGYNVYRQGKYYTTVYKTEFQDAAVKAQDYSYEIKAFEKSGSGTRYYTIAKGLTVSVPANSVSGTFFSSSETSGFIGEVVDDAVRVSWRRDPQATGYNIYRQGKYYNTVYKVEFLDTNIQAQDYAYEIKAFEKSGGRTRYYTIATGLTVSISTLGKPILGAANTDLSSSSSSGDNDSVNVATGGTTTSNTTTTALNKTVSGATESKTNNVVDGNTTTSATGSSTAEKYSVPAKQTVAEKTVSVDNKHFRSVTNDGFTGDVLDNSIRIRWKADPNASGYNVYRQAKYYTTVFTNEYIDTKVYDQNYYYEIQAFEHRANQAGTRYYYVATGLTVAARTLGKIDPNRPKTNAAMLKNYELVFFDEFNGDSLDASKWNTSFLWGTDLIINNEEQYYVDILKDPEFGVNPFSFDGSNLTINTVKTPPELAKKSLNQPYLSGIMTSYDAFKFTYGYAEIRAKMTHGRGYWPAFWLLNAYYGGDNPEIDIMEFVGDNQDVVYHTFHYHDDSGKLRSTKSEPTPGIDYTSDFHTFSVEWKPGSIIYYVDGIEVHRITDSKVPREQMYLLINTAVGGWWAGSPDKYTPFPGTYQIDYVRVYQKSTLYNDELFDDGMTAIPYADDILNPALPNHRPTQEQWPEGYPFR